MTENFYQERAHQFQSQITVVDKIIRQLAWTRLLIAALILLFGYFGFNHSIFFSAIPLLVIGFFYFVQSQQKKESERNLLLHLVHLNQWESKAFQFDFSNFPAGEQFINPTHPFSHDLDLFGNGSVFQYINRCATQIGEKKLADDLTSLKFTKEEIIERQEAIRELAQQLELRQQCWAIGQQIQKGDGHLSPLFAWLREPNLFLGKRFFQIAKWVFPFITCAAFVAIVFDSTFEIIFFLLFISQIGFAAAYSKPISILQNKLAGYRMLLENYAKLLNKWKGLTFQSAVLNQHQQKANEAAENVHAFSKLVNALETRMNMFARFFGNGLFLYDFHSVTRLEAWRDQHAHELQPWIDSLAEWDALLSFGTLHFNQPRYAFAEFEDDFSIKATAAGHLLIPSSERVNNSFDLGNPASVMLITGANMAGKSTFLRAVGTNYVLALNGAPVCATHWSCPIGHLRTGMRTSDSLQEHKSYFFAELNRLQSIVQELKSSKPMIILLDEILKGTNSTDKQSGSRELIKQLIHYKALVMVATHDIALGDMEQQFPNQITNACFEGKIENEELTFDYCLNKGLAQKANATFLMRKMGIIP